MRVFLSCIGALALSACEETPTQALSEAEVAQAPAPVEPIGPTSDVSDALEETEEALVSRIPARFHGIWDFVEGTWALESDLRLDISGAEILFYESLGTVVAIREETERTIVTLAMEGEGETWEDQYALTLTDDGQQLLPQFVGGDQVYEPMPRKRCPK